MSKTYPKTMAYLDSFGIDPGSVARTGVSPEGYYSPMPTVTGTMEGKDLSFTVDKGWTLWPAGFDYNEFQKCLWKDEQRMALR